MRLLTRSDFDGLVCAVLLKEVEQLDSIEFHHPKDMQDGKVEVSSNDIITNLPYQPDVGLWFDHHASESTRNEEIIFNGRYELAPSTARVIYNYYVLKGQGDKLTKYDSLLIEVDKSDSANLDPEDVLDPKGWILLSYLMDPRTGLAKSKDYQISNKELMMKLVDWISEHTAEEILELPDIKERVDRYLADTNAFKDALSANSKEDGNVVVTDLRNKETPTGNRFMIYTLYPNTNISIRVMDGKNKEFVVFAVGHSIFNRTSKTDVGALMAKFGGGGHRGAGTCQVPLDVANEVLDKLVEIMKKDG